LALETDLLLVVQVRLPGGLAFAVCRPIRRSNGDLLLLDVREGPADYSAWMLALAREKGLPGKLIIALSSLLSHMLDKYSKVEYNIVDKDHEGRKSTR
jgi:hypothetical protein